MRCADQSLYLDDGASYWFFSADPKVVTVPTIRSIIQCAVKRCMSPAGASRARPLSLQPVAIGASCEATNSMKPLVERVATGDLASMQAVT